MLRKCIVFFVFFIGFHTAFAGSVGPLKVSISSAKELAELGDVEAGTEIIWKNGKYSDQIIQIEGVGTPERPIVLRAETPGKVKLLGESYLIIKGSYIQVEGFHWENPIPVDGESVVKFDKNTTFSTLKNCAITGKKLKIEKNIDTKWVSLYGEFNKVESCTFLDKRNMGTLLVVWLQEGVTPKHIIKNNYFQRPKTIYGDNGKARNGQETIRIGTSTYSMQYAECVVDSNYFYKCNGELGEIVSNKSCGNIYTNNLFVENNGTLTLRHGNDCIVRGNLFYGYGYPETGGVRIIGEGHLVENNYFEELMGSGFKSAICIVQGEKNPKLSGYWQVKDVIVRNNTIVNCKNAMTVNYGSSKRIMPVLNTLIEGNIISQNDKSYYSINLSLYPPAQISWKDNKIFGEKIEGVTLQTLSVSPDLPNMYKIAKNITSEAGCLWKL